MMRYRMLVIAAVVMMFPTLQLGASDAPVVKSILKSTKTSHINDLLKKDISTLNQTDLVRVKAHLTLQRSSEVKELREQPEEEIDCCLGCLGLAPFALGLYCDVSNMSPSMYGISLGKVIGAIAGAAAVVKFDNGDQPPQTEVSNKLALVTQELQKRQKIKRD